MILPRKIALCTVGSTGDIRPFVLLGKRLMARGHDVAAISHPYHEAAFTSAGIPFRGCGPIIDHTDINDMLDLMMSKRNPIKQIETLMKEAFFADGEMYFRQAKAALADRELAICHMIDFLGNEAAAQLRIPRIGVILTHAIVPTRVSTPTLVPNLGPLNPLAWWAMSKVLSGVDREAKRFLATLGGPSIDIKRFSALSPDLNLLAASPLLAGVPARYLPPHITCTGHWHENADPNQTLPPDMQAFLTRHPNPVIVSFGSMGGKKGPELSAIVQEALQLAKLPGIIQAGYADIHVHENGQFLNCGPMEHDLLFDQGSCILHHGGAGTTMAACRAGKPSVVVAFIADQPYFAQRLHRLGLAPKMIWREKLNPKILAKRLLQAQAPAMRARAEEMKEAFRQEDGLGKAVEVVEGYGS